MTTPRAPNAMVTLESSDITMVSVQVASTIGGMLAEARYSMIC